MLSLRFAKQWISPVQNYKLKAIAHYHYRKVISRILTSCQSGVCPVWWPESVSAIALRSLIRGHVGIPFNSSVSMTTLWCHIGCPWEAPHCDWTCAWCSIASIINSWVRKFSKLIINSYCWISTSSSILNIPSNRGKPLF